MLRGARGRKLCRLAEPSRSDSLTPGAGPTRRGIRDAPGRASPASLRSQLSAPGRAPIPARGRKSSFFMRPPQSVHGGPHRRDAYVDASLLGVVLDPVPQKRIWRGACVLLEPLQVDLEPGRSRQLGCDDVTHLSHQPEQSADGGVSDAEVLGGAAIRRTGLGIVVIDDSEPKVSREWLHPQVGSKSRG